MHYIGVLPDKFRRGISKLRGPHTYVDKQSGRTLRFEPESQWRSSLEEALKRKYTTDAHCTCYWVEDQDKLPLLKKEVLSEMIASDAPVLQTAIMLDWDVPGHAPLQQEHVSYFLGKIIEAEQQHPELANWFAFYTTAHGTRLVYQPIRPTGVQEGERYTRALINMFNEVGLELDQSCCDWTRRFRLPHVVRDGKITDPVLQIKGHQLDLKNIKKAHKKSLVFHRDFERKNNHPTQEESEKRLKVRNPQTRQVNQTRFYKKAKTELKKSDWFDVLFNEADFYTETGRNDLLQQVLGEIIPPLVQKAGATAEDIFALMYGPLCQWDQLPGKQHPHEHAWNFIQDICEREICRYNEDKDKEASKEDSASDLLMLMAEGMQVWDDAVELESDDEDVKAEYVKRHLFCRIRSIYVPMLADGTYSEAVLREGDLIPYIQTSYMKDVVDVYKWTTTGDKVFKPATDIINAHACIAQELDFRPQMPSGGIVEGKYKQKPSLVLPMYRRSAFISSEYNEHVDGWLKCLLGAGYYDGCKWIAYSLDFEAGPICALSLQGAGGTGKKMLIEGLAECLETPCFINASSVAGNSQSMLLKSPFLNVNEAWPKTSNQAPRDYFKSMTSGDRLAVAEKYLPNTTCLNPIRMILTANDPDLIYALTESGSLSAYNRQAIGDRLLHFEVSDAAKIYLADRGGLGFTAQEGSRWIRGDAGQDSDYVVAKHFMWMYENRHERWPVNSRDRLCVMGNCGSESAVSQDMAARAPSVSTIIKSIIGVTEQMNKGFKDYTRYRESTCQLYISEAGVSKYAKEILASNISDKEVTDGMQNLIKSDTPILDNHKNYYEVDCESVLNFATGRGLDAPVLRGISEGQARKKQEAENN